jgi:hypothetical protein
MALLQEPHGSESCYSGDRANVEEVMAPIRALRDPVVDLLREQAYTELQSYLDATEPKGMHYYWKTEYAAELGEGLLSALRDLFASCLFMLRTRGSDGSSRWAYRYRVGGRGSRRVPPQG